MEIAKVTKVYYIPKRRKVTKGKDRKGESA